MKKYGFLVLIISLLFTQCTSDEYNTPDNYDMKVTSRTCVGFSSGESITVGSLHNTYLDEIFAEFNCVNGDPEAEAIASFETFAENEELDPGLIEYILESSIDGFDLSNYSANFDDFTTASNLYDDILLAVSSNLYYVDISDDLDDVKSDANTYLTCYDLSLINTVAEVARNSSYYWTPTDYDGAGNEGPCGIPQAREEADKWWHSFIKSDLEGATLAICEYGLGLAIPGANAEIAIGIASTAAWHSALFCYTGW